MDLVSRADKRDGRGRVESAPAVAEAARGGFEKGGEKLLGVVVGQGNAEEIGTPRMGIFLIASSMTGGVLQKHLPRRMSSQKFIFRSFLTKDFNHMALRPATDLQERRCCFGGLERAGRIVIGKGNEERRDFRSFSDNAIPPVAVAVVDRGAAPENLLHTRGDPCPQC